MSQLDGTVITVNPDLLTDTTPDRTRVITHTVVGNEDG